MLVAVFWCNHLNPGLLGTKEQVLVTCFWKPLVFPFTWDFVPTLAPFCAWKSSPSSLCSKANHRL